jgi:hypothetical protein
LRDACGDPLRDAWGEPLREPFRAVLNELYRDQIVALEDYLQLDLRSWRVDGAKVT